MLVYPLNKTKLKQNKNLSRRTPRGRRTTSGLTNKRPKNVSTTGPRRKMVLFFFFRLINNLKNKEQWIRTRNKPSQYT